MTPEYIKQLADLADPDKLWSLGWEEQRSLEADKRHQLDMGVALRRHADEVRQLRALIGTGRSLVFTPMGFSGKAVMTIEAPPQHQRLLDVREAAGLEDIARARLGTNHPEGQNVPKAVAHQAPTPVALGGHGEGT